MSTISCPRCSSAVASANDVGAGVGRCGGCGCWLCTGEARARLTTWLGVDERIWHELVRQGARGPGCSLCGRGLRTLSLKGVVVDGCSECGALLLDPGELSRLTGLQEAPLKSSPSASIADAASMDDAAPMNDAASEDDSASMKGAASVEDAALVHDAASLARAGVGRVYGPPAVLLAHFIGKTRWLHLVQERQFAEQLLSLEFGNRYLVRGPSGTGQILVDEGTGAALARVFLGGLLRTRYTVCDARETPVLSLLRSFHRLVLSKMEVSLWSGTNDGRVLGSVERNFGVMTSSYDLLDARGRRFARLERPVLSLWQFRLLDSDGRPVGAVAKEWSGLATEWFSDADNFGIDFGDVNWNAAQRAVVLGAALAIDLDHFERKGSSSVLDSVFD